MFSNANNNAPEELIVKKYRRFERKIRGRKKKDFESGNVCSLEETYLEVQKVLAD